MLYLCTIKLIIIMTTSKFSPKQIEQIKKITAWTSTRYHGNTKVIGSLPLSLIKSIVAKKVHRELLKCDSSAKGEATITRELINNSTKSISTNYHKIMIEGNTGIYLAHPSYQHSDYNKSRLFNKTEKTLKLMDLFNKIISKN